MRHGLISLSNNATKYRGYSCRSTSTPTPTGGNKVQNLARRYSAMAKQSTEGNYVPQNNIGKSPQAGASKVSGVPGKVTPSAAASTSQSPAKVPETKQEQEHEKDPSSKADELSDKVKEIDLAHETEAAPIQSEPVVDEPVHEEPTHVEPAHEEPTHVEPAHEEPIHQEPAHEEPVHEEPVREEPVHVEPAHEEPAHEEPVHEESAKEQEQEAPAKAAEEITEDA
ncbi:hypothetical protein BGX21_010731 [Mortierella sp. AD011]|nr:hypothetical protein BGX21_010731 [Mortierella sp. AD011]